MFNFANLAAFSVATASKLFGIVILTEGALFASFDRLGTLPIVSVSVVPNFPKTSLPFKFADLVFWGEDEAFLNY